MDTPPQGAAEGAAETPKSDPGRPALSPAIARLMEEVRSLDPGKVGCFDRAHNRHNRS